MIFHFVKIMDDLKLFKGKTPKIRFGDAIFWGNSWNMIQKYGGLIGPKNVKILEFQKVEISKIHIFQWCSLIFSCIVWSKFMRNTGSEGPLRVQRIENFGSSQNHPKSIGIWPGTLISHFGIIKPHTPN